MGIDRLKQFLDGTKADRLAFLWGVAEATLGPVLPDVLLSLTGIFSPRRVWRQGALAALGAAIGGAIMFSWGARSPARARAVVSRVPLVREAMWGRAESEYAARGLWAVARGPVKGIPYKVYAVLAPQHAGMFSFTVVSFPSRIWRFLLLGFAGTLLARGLGPDRRGWALVLWASVWVTAYAAYWLFI